jgi:uncharacterized protein YeaO (DUF488 family)
MPFLHDSIYNVPPRSKGASAKTSAEGAWRVLIMRRWPRGVRKERVDEWCPDAAPSLELLKQYRDGALSFDGFARRYEEELHERPAVLQHLREQERMHRTVVLLCWERPPQHCHREVLARLLNTRRKERRRAR